MIHKLCVYGVTLITRNIFFAGLYSIVLSGSSLCILILKLATRPHILYACKIIKFRVPWFQYPVIYDIRAKPFEFSSPTGTKGTCITFYPAIKIPFLLLFLNL